MKHLWEVEHPYYCNEGNYYQNGCGQEYSTFAEFMESEGDSDIDYNLLFRWDWKEDGEYCFETNAAKSSYNGDDYYRNGRLLLFFMGQRKGAYLSLIHI